VIAIVVFAVSAYKLYGIFSEYNKGDKEYQKIQDLVINTEKKDDTKEETFSVDFEKLLEMNSDVVGWIRFDEPSEINYPVVQGRDNEEYLKRTFEANTNKLGTLFVDVNNPGDFSGRNTFIYGHNMKNGSMFAQLLKYKDDSFYKEHPYFYIYTPDGKVRTYEIFSAGVVKDTSDSYIMDYADDAAFQTYIDYIKQQSAYPTSTEVTTASKIVSLSTCTNVRDDERFLVHGVMIKEEAVK
jgi:sortase B